MWSITCVNQLQQHMLFLSIFSLSFGFGLFFVDVLIHWFSIYHHNFVCKCHHFNSFLCVPSLIYESEFPLSFWIQGSIKCLIFLLFVNVIVSVSTVKNEVVLIDIFSVEWPIYWYFINVPNLPGPVPQFCWPVERQLSKNWNDLLCWGYRFGH